MFVKRYSFNTSAAIKRDDEIRIPLHITLNQGLVSEPELFPPLSPTTRNIDFKTSKLLKISLLSYDNKNRAERLEVLCWMRSVDVHRIMQLEGEKRQMQEENKKLMMRFKLSVSNA
ncbi:hypothetical protein WUBG_08414 [Wuchereria bancrofti]|nr:hypothetical protein WUBG_08414 [Wuchereria bancrofti]